MISIHCTSCKKALEVDEQTLSNREVSVVRCPGCEVTLTVDKRKGTSPVVTGPVVKIASEEYKPLLPHPTAEELTSSGAFGGFVSLVAATYGGAEAHLRKEAAIAARLAEVCAVESRTRDALSAMQVEVPAPSSSDDARQAVATPDEPRLDHKLKDLADYLSATATITETTGRIWKNVTAHHWYTPIAKWQERADGVVEEAYTDAARRSPRIAQTVVNLGAIARDYDALVERHGNEHAALRNLVGLRQKDVEKLDADVTAAQHGRADLERQAGAAAMVALKPGGCGGLIAATVISGIVAVTTKQEGVGWVAFFLTFGVILFLAYSFGFNRNSRERVAADRRFGDSQLALRNGQRELATARKNAEAHDATSPEHAAPTIPDDWALLTCDDFDTGRPRRRSEMSEASAPHMLHARNTPDLAVATVPVLNMSQPVVSPSTAVARAGTGAVAQAAPSRAVGFRPSNERQPMASTSAIMPALVSDIIEPEPIASTPIETVVELGTDTSRRRSIIIGVMVFVVIAVASYVIWASAFSLEARMKKALAAGQIFAPAGASVYDLYRSELARNPQSKMLAAFGPAIQNAIGPAADDAFARWYKDSDDTLNWPELERTCDFLAIVDPATSRHRMRKLYAAAQQNIDAHEYLNAIQNYENALKLDPSWALALNGIGKVYMIERSPHYNERLSVTYYERAVSADPQFTWAAKNLGDYYARTNDYSRAEQYLHRALATSPERPSILRALGNVCRHTHRASDAIAFYERALTFEKDPDKVAAILKSLSATRRDR
jgi:tetratricopeptide (TPR) repeat protein